jgi:RHS repeat-associated protein
MGAATKAAVSLLVWSFAAAAGAQVVEYYHVDAVGSVRALTSQAGQVIERHDYLPFGEECTTGPCASNPGLNAGQPRKYTGKERDKETGLDYFGARYYGSKIGRFTTTDPVYTWQENLVDPQRWNRYAYARNNPLRYVDPDGRTIVTYFGGLITAFGSNLTGGLVPRPTGGDSDFQFGQFVGDTLSLAAAGYEASLGGGLLVGGGAATGTVVAAELGVPAAVVGGVAIGHAALFGGSAAINLSKNNADLGSIYKVPGSATPSGKPYIGRHNKPDPAKTRRSRDGRDRTQAEVIDNYEPGNTQEGRVKEQAQIDKRGLGNLDNKRNEIRKD